MRLGVTYLSAYYLIVEKQCYANSFRNFGRGLAFDPNKPFDTGGNISVTESNFCSEDCLSDKSNYFCRDFS